MKLSIHSRWGTVCGAAAFLLLGACAYNPYELTDIQQPEESYSESQLNELWAQPVRIQVPELRRDYIYVQRSSEFVRNRPPAQDFNLHRTSQTNHNRNVRPVTVQPEVRTLAPAPAITPAPEKIIPAAQPDPPQEQQRDLAPLFLSE